MSSMRSGTNSGTSNIVGHLVAALPMIVVTTATLMAQQPESTRLEYTTPPSFEGFWQIIDGEYELGHGFKAVEACGALKDPGGEPMIRCSLPWEAKGGATFGLKDKLNKRGLAWMQFRDEQMSEKHLCIPNTLPAIQDKWLGFVFYLGPGELHIEAPTDAFTEGVRRVVWMDGRKHPAPHVQLFQGHSIGWYEGDELVIETTNFTFNPDGLEDHTHVASSAHKVVTERWKKLSPTRLDITYTVEDQLFLKEPVVFTWHYERTPPPAGRNQVNFVCDPEVAWSEALIAMPSRYTVD